MYGGRPLWNCQWERGIQLGQGEGPIGIVGPMSKPYGTIDTASRKLIPTCLLYTSPSPRDRQKSRMPSSA